MSKGYTVVLGKWFDNETQDEALRLRTKSLIRLTYRRDFPSFDPYAITSDAGWGCMLRSAQTMMANVFLRHYLGKDWMLPASKDEMLKSTQYFEIIKWFIDIPGPPHYFSLHHMVQLGIKYSKLPGEWFGPSTAALVLRDICEQQRKLYRGSITVYVANGDTVYNDEIKKLCETPESPSEENSSSAKDDEDFFDPLLNQPPQVYRPWLYALLVLLPLRLGIERVNDEYYQELKEVLEQEYCVGILGGRPNHALFFAGYNSYNQILGLDPHTTYPAPTFDESFPKDDYLNQIHVNDFERMDMTRLDPSLAIGFYFRNQQEYEEWYNSVSEANIFKNSIGRVPLFHVGKLAPSYHSCSYSGTSDDEEEEDRNGEKERKRTEDQDDRYDVDAVEGYDDDDDEDYVILPDFK